MSIHLSLGEDGSLARHRTNTVGHPCADDMWFEQLMIVIQANRTVGRNVLGEAIRNRAEESVGWVEWSRPVNSRRIN